MSDYTLHSSGRFFHKEDVPNPTRGGKVFIGCGQCREIPVAGPPHEPSPRCESGSRTHCSCNRCF